MEHLSGGEKTIAALALLFAIHSYQPSPFFVLDEVDAALDNVNVSRVATYVREHASPGMQFIVISLKAGFFQESETLVGVMRDQAKMTSKYLTLDVSSPVWEVLGGICTNLLSVAEVSACLDEWLGTTRTRKDGRWEWNVQHSILVTTRRCVRRLRLPSQCCYSAAMPLFSYMFPPPLHNDLHFIDRTKLALLLLSRDFCPKHDSLLDFPLLPPCCCNPPP
jgi:hypothetical protein